MLAVRLPVTDWRPSLILRNQVGIWKHTTFSCRPRVMLKSESNNSESPLSSSDWPCILLCTVCKHTRQTPIGWRGRLWNELPVGFSHAIFRAYSCTVYAGACTVLYCTVLYCTCTCTCTCTVLYCTVLYCTVLYCNEVIQ